MMEEAPCGSIVVENEMEEIQHYRNTIYIFKKLINNSRGKYKRNECSINVCKSDKDLS
jgi:hypothetical protein